MAKRVKKGVRIELPAVGARLARVATEEDGDLVVSPVGGGVSWNLCLQHCEALGMTAVLEDVPTPGERLLAALENEGLHVTSEVRSPVAYMACLERVAHILDIKPEDE